MANNSSNVIQLPARKVRKKAETNKSRQIHKTPKQRDVMLTDKRLQRFLSWWRTLSRDHQIDVEQFLALLAEAERRGDQLAMRAARNGISTMKCPELLKNVVASLSHRLIA